MTPNFERKNIENDPLHPFVTPENYFATFKERLKQRIEEEEKVQSEVKSQTRKLWKPYVYWSIGAAAVLLLAVSLWTLSPVSYTHLDVYKRQSGAGGRQLAKRLYLSLVEE